MSFKKICSFLIVTALVSGIFLTIYTTVQQSYRQSANDPQIQMAEDAAQLLKNGALPADIVPHGQSIDMSESLAPYIMIFDAKGTVLESSVRLGNTLPVLPKGVLDASLYGENRLTWQPEKDVRQAIVVVSYYPGPDGGTFEANGGGFVLAGRNLREVELRESQLTLMVFVAWLASMVCLFVLFIGHIFWKKRV